MVEPAWSSASVRFLGIGSRRQQGSSYAVQVEGWGESPAVEVAYLDFADLAGSFGAGQNETVFGIVVDTVAVVVVQPDTVVGLDTVVAVVFPTDAEGIGCIVLVFVRSKTVEKCWNSLMTVDTGIVGNFAIVGAGTIVVWIGTVIRTVTVMYSDVMGLIWSSWSLQEHWGRLNGQIFVILIQTVAYPLEEADILEFLYFLTFPALKITPLLIAFI